MQTAQLYAEQIYLAAVDRCAELLREDLSESASGVKAADLVTVVCCDDIEPILAERPDRDGSALAPRRDERPRASVCQGSGSPNEVTGIS